MPRALFTLAALLGVTVAVLGVRTYWLRGIHTALATFPPKRRDCHPA